MDIHVKIIITSICIWLVTYISAFPGSRFSNWGEKKFGDYVYFLVLITIFTLILPSIVCGLHWLWVS